MNIWHVSQPRSSIKDCTLRSEIVYFIIYIIIIFKYHILVLNCNKILKEIFIVWVS
jgi:hypothetical protein